MQAPLPELPPTCPKCTALLRPDIVLYTESLPATAFSNAITAAESCDLMFVIGTSGVVYPAAGLPEIAQAHDVVIVEINPQETALTAKMDFSLRATAAQSLPAIVGTFIEASSRG